MPGMDIFKQDAFGMMSLTAAINEREFVPSRLRSMGLFTTRSVATTTIAIEKKGLTLSLIQTSPRGAPPAQRVQDKRDIRDLRVPHLAKEVVVYADQVQGVRAFGSESDLEMVQNVVDQETEAVATEVDLTEEHLMMGAIQGDILDADGSTIYNLFTEFGVAQPSAINFALSTDTTKVRNKCHEVIRTMGRSLGMGNIPFQVHGLCSDSFFDALVSHPDVEQAYERWQDGAMLRENLAWQTFNFAGISFENYRGTDDNSTIAVPDGDCRFFLRGVPGLFIIVYAPADRNSTVNTMGLPRYMFPNNEDTGNGRYQKFEIQANPLPICTKPGTLLRGTAS